MLNPRNYTDKQLVEGCIQNDRKSQEVLYRKYFNTMIHMCLRYTSDREIAMEIVNNGFLRVFRKLDTFSFKGSLEGWIRRIVFHSLSEYFKKHSKYMQFLVFEDRDATFQENTLSNLYVEDILKLVDELPPATKNVFQLYAIEGFTHVEIAKQTNISVGTSKWHLASARKTLQQLLRKKNNNRLYAG